MSYKNKYNIIDKIVEKLPKGHDWKRPKNDFPNYNTKCIICNFVIYYDGFEWYSPMACINYIPSSCEAHRMNQALE